MACFVIPKGTLTRNQIIEKCNPDIPKAKAVRILDDLREKFPEMATPIFKRASGNHTYAYNEIFVKKAIEVLLEFSNVAKMKVINKMEWYTDSELAEKFKTRRGVIRDVVEKYNIGDTETVQKIEPHWKIHKSLYGDLCEQLVPAQPLVATGHKISRKPSLDWYDQFS